MHTGHIQCLCFIGIARSVGETAGNIYNDLGTSRGPLSASPSAAKLDSMIADINKRFVDGRNVYDSTPGAPTLREAGLVTHQFDALAKPGEPWAPCVGDECGKVADSLAVILADGKTIYNLGPYQGGFVSTCLISQSIANMNK
jgi:hypothetical protein